MSTTDEEEEAYINDALINDKDEKNDEINNIDKNEERNEENCIRLKRASVGKDVERLVMFSTVRYVGVSVNSINL